MVHDEHVHVLAAEVMKGYSKKRIIKIINCKAVYLLFSVQIIPIKYSFLLSFSTVSLVLVYNVTTYLNIRNF